MIRDYKRNAQGQLINRRAVQVSTAFKAYRNFNFEKPIASAFLIGGALDYVREDLVIGTREGILNYLWGTDHFAEIRFIENNDFSFSAELCSDHYFYLTSTLQCIYWRGFNSKQWFDGALVKHQGQLIKPSGSWL